MNISRVRSGAAFKASPIKLPTVFGASLRTPPRTASKPPRRLAFGSNGDRFYRLVSRWELVTSALARSLGETVHRCARFHQTRARRRSHQDLSADTSHSVDGQPFVESTSRQNGRNDDFATCERMPLGRGKIAMARIAASRVSASSIEHRSRRCRSRGSPSG